MKKTDGKDVKVSIICLVYNHEKYVSKTLEGFVSQETDFDYEIIVHDDASTDNSFSIISSYMEKYSNIICIHQTENQWEKYYVGNELVESAKGKYIALCEGDDFWHDTHKLQVMYEAMEQHDDCSLGVHRAVCCNEDGSPLQEYIPNSSYGLDKDVVLSPTEVAHFLFVGEGYPFHTSGFFFKKSAYVDNFPTNWVKFPKDIDYIKAMIMAGNVLYVDKDMSTRRVNAL